MDEQLFAIRIDARDPRRLARFWAGVLGREPAADGVTLPPGDDRGFRIHFTPSDVPKTGQNRLHFDLTSTSLDDQRHTVARALELGGRHADVGQLPEEKHVVLADPEGNEFCVVEPGNNFLAGCGLIGALSCDGTRAVGHFWSAALGWPLVWDQDEETAIQSPAGGPKIAWGGPPLMPRDGRDRLRLELTAPDDGARLIGLGAARTDPDGTMTDPDGNTFHLVGHVLR